MHQGAEQQEIEQKMSGRPGAMVSATYNTTVGRVGVKAPFTPVPSPWQAGWASRPRCSSPLQAEAASRMCRVGAVRNRNPDSTTAVTCAYLSGVLPCQPSFPSAPRSLTRNGLRAQLAAEGRPLHGCQVPLLGVVTRQVEVANGGALGGPAGVEWSGVEADQPTALAR